MAARSLGVVLVGGSLLAAALVGSAEAAGTCLYAPPVLHHVDPALRQSDASAPGTPVVVDVVAFRRNGMTCTRESCIANSCGDSATVRIELAPSADDATPPAELGYRLLLVRGELPESMQRSMPLTLAAGQPVFLRPDFDELPSLDVSLAAVAVDAAGNESEPTEPFDVRFDGCTLAAIGARCEDELSPDVDLSTLWGDEADEVTEASGQGVEGASCSIGRSTSTPVWASLLFAGSLLWLRRRRESRAVLPP